MKGSAALRFAKRLIHCSYAVFASQLHFRRVIRGNFLSDIVLGGIELPWRLRHRKLLQMTDPALHAFRDRMDTSLIDIVGSFLTRQYAGDQLVYIGEAIKVDPIKIGHQLQLLGVVVFEGLADHILFRAHLTGHLIIAKGRAAVIAYNTTRPQLEKLMADLKTMLDESPYTQKGSNIVRPTSFGDSSINILVSAYLQTNAYAVFLEEQNDLNLNIMDIMQADGVDFAFPSTSVYIEKSGS